MTSFPRTAEHADGERPDAAPVLAERLDLRAAWAVAAAACAVLGLLETLKAYLFQALQGSTRSWRYVFLEQMPWWVLWMALLPLVFWVARTYRFDGPRWKRGAAVHVAIGLAISLAHVSASGALHHRLLGEPGGRTLGDHVQTFVLRFLFTDIVIYGAAVGVYYACEYFAGYRRSTLAAARSEALAARLQLSLAEARIHALRMELNPHFLFNALNAIAGLVRKREHQAAVDMLARLGELLRTTLDRDMPAEVPLAEELELLRRFLDIEQVRFGDRLRVSWELEVEAQGALVPPLILQPLVENALRHGVTRRMGPALLRIGARRVGLHLELTVRDSGEGLALHDGRAPREGIGLSNTRARLAQLYGPEGTLLELDDAPGGGVRARVLLPYHEARERDDVAVGA
ncbi:MAG TPA: histidine kinase [Gemmatimonadaceae bacterium]|jgi:hypothetical protein|nr:histidine kinase [Gemmatimonadaceae bacterium]